MNNQSTLMNIIKLVFFFVIASLLLKVAFSIIGGAFYLAFRFGIPLLIAIGVVRWLTNRSNTRRYN